MLSLEWRKKLILFSKFNIRDYLGILAFTDVFYGRFNASCLYASLVNIVKRERIGAEYIDYPIKIEGGEFIIYE